MTNLEFILKFWIKLLWNPTPDRS